MSRLPVPGSDDGVWGEILNDFLSQSLNSDGSIKNSAVSTVGGVTVSGTPTTGQVLTATSSSAADWQAASGLALSGWTEDSSNPANLQTNGGNLELVGGQLGFNYNQYGGGLDYQSFTMANGNTSGSILVSADTGFEAQPATGTAAFTAFGDSGATIALNANGLNLENVGQISANTSGGLVQLSGWSGVSSSPTSGNAAFSASSSNGATVAFDGAGLPIQNIADPTNAQDTATKNYVDTNGGGLPSWFMSGTTDPYGAIAPSQTGALYVDTQFGMIYTALGPSNTDWFGIAGPINSNATGTYSDSTGTIQILVKTGRALSLSDAVSMFGGTGNRLSWDAGGGDGGQTLQLQLGSSGQFIHNWAANGDYMAQGTISTTDGTGTAVLNNSGQIQADPNGSATCFVALGAHGSTAALDCGNLPILNLPTSNPHIVGALWNNAGTPAISAG